MVAITKGKHSLKVGFEGRRNYENSEFDIDDVLETTIEKMKLSIYGASVELVCMKCGEPQGARGIGELSEEPRCSRCGSS
jgi:formylmethanofuran dehydrogenase subunit E